MSRNELIAKIEALNEWEAMMEEAKTEADAIRSSIKAEMEERGVEELQAGSYIIRWTSVLSTPQPLSVCMMTSTKRSPSKLHPADSVSAHEKSPLSDCLPSHRQRASYHTPKERVQRLYCIRS